MHEIGVILFLVSLSYAIAIEYQFPKTSSIIGIWPLNGNPSDIGPLKLQGIVNGKYSIGPFGDANTAVQSTGSGPSFSVTSKFISTAKSFTVMLYFAKSSDNRDGSLFEFQDAFDTNMAFQFRYKDNAFIEVAANGAVIGLYNMVRQNGGWTFVAFTFEYDTSTLTVYSRHGMVSPASFQAHVRASTAFNNNGVRLGTTKRWEHQAVNSNDSFACLMVYSTVLTFPEIMEAHHACRNAISLPCGTPKVSIDSRLDLTCGSSLTPKPGQFPWIVSLRYNGNHICSATIVDQYWLLTVAKCFSKSLNLTDYQIVTGEHDLKVEESFSELRNISSIFLQGKHEHTLDGARLALFSVEFPLNFSSVYVTDACFLATDSVDENDVFQPHVIHGWGINGRTSLTSPSLPRYGHMSLLKDEQCLGTCGESQYLGNGVNYCFNAGTWPCDADEGSPVMIQSLRNTTLGERTVSIQVGLYYERDGCVRGNRPLFTGLGRKQYQWLTERLSCNLPGSLKPTVCPQL